MIRLYSRKSKVPSWAISYIADVPVQFGGVVLFWRWKKVIYAKLLYGTSVLYFANSKGTINIIKIGFKLL